MIEHRFYIIHPGGRERIEAHCNAAAVEAFNKHWTASADWALREGKTYERKLVRETREELIAEVIVRH